MNTSITNILYCVLQLLKNMHLISYFVSIMMVESDGNTCILHFYKIHLHSIKKCSWDVTKIQYIINKSELLAAGNESMRYGSMYSL